MRRFDGWRLRKLVGFSVKILICEAQGGGPRRDLGARHGMKVAGRRLVEVLLEGGLGFVCGFLLCGRTVGFLSTGGFLT